MSDAFEKYLSALQPPLFETLAIEPDSYKKLKCKPDSVHSRMLKELAKCDVRHIDSSGSSVEGSFSNSVVKIISFNNDFPILSSFAPQLIYERSFYSNLLATIRGYDAKFRDLLPPGNNARQGQLLERKRKSQVVLTGSPGISKSFFQLYYLARILNTEKFGPLPPDLHGSTEPPKVVIRQVGDSEMFIYDIENRRAERYCGISTNVFCCFDPATSIYFMEPAEGAPIHPIDVDMPLLFTSVPEEKRFKGVIKHGGSKLFMPMYTLHELIAIGTYLLNNGYVPEELQAFYTTDLIRDRYEIYGGIISHVLPLTRYALNNNNTKRLRTQVIRTCDCSRLIRRYFDEINDFPEDQFTLQYIVFSEHNVNFSRLTHDVISDRVFEDLKERIDRVSYDDKVRAIIFNDERSGHMERVVSDFYKDVLVELLLCKNDVFWKRRFIRVTDSALLSSRWMDLTEKRKRKVTGACPQLCDMKPNIIYKPAIAASPFCDFFYKSSENDHLVVFIVTRQEDVQISVSLSALQDFIRRMDIQLEDVARVIRVVIIPRRANAGKAFLHVVRDVSDGGASKHLMDALSAYEVWVPPVSYEKTYYWSEKIDDIRTDIFTIES